MNKKKMLWGTARVQFLAIYPEVIQLFQQGFPTSQIYSYLQEQGKITMCLYQFRHYLKIYSPLPQKKEIKHASEKTVPQIQIPSLLPVPSKTSSPVIKNSSLPSTQIRDKEQAFEKLKNIDFSIKMNTDVDLHKKI